MVDYANDSAGDYLRTASSIYCPLGKPVIRICHLHFFVSMFIGATMAAYSAQGKGLLYGLAVSMSYFLLTIIGGLILDSSIFTLAFVVKDWV